MNSPGRPVSSGQFSWLTDQTQMWVDRQLISPETQLGILSCYETKEERQFRTRHNGLLAILSLAVFLLGLSALLLVGYNWKEMSGAAKLTVVFSALILTQIVGLVFQARQKIILSEVSFFFSCLLFGVGIWQIAQIFHVSSYYPDGVWLWALGTFVMALTLKTPVVHILTVVLLGVWVCMECSFNHLGPGFLRDTYPWLPNVTISLPVFAIVGLYWSKARQSLFIEYLYFLLLIWWLLFLPCGWQTVGTGPFYYIFLGCMFWLIPIWKTMGTGTGIGIGTGIGSGIGTGMVTNQASSGILFADRISPLGRFSMFAGSLMIAAGLVVPSFDEYSHQAFSQGMIMGPETINQQYVLMALFYICLPVAILTWTGMFIRGLATSENRKVLAQNRYFLVLSAATFVAWFWLLGYRIFDEYFESILCDTGIWFTFFINVLMFCYALSFIFQGLQNNRGLIFGFGIVYFLFWSILRYFDLFFVAGGMLGASVMFFGCAIVLFAVAFWWNHRKNCEFEAMKLQQASGRLGGSDD